MINIDTVYQKVLALANKEQRGYVTPQEFNLLADKAQLDIFDSYFHDVKTAYYKPKNQTGFSNELEILSEKLQPLRSSVDIQNDGSSPNLTLPTDLYRIDTIIDENNYRVIEISKKNILLTEGNPLTKATTIRPTYVRDTNSSIRLYPVPSGTTNSPVTYEVSYFKKPTSPNWGYVVVNEKALYNSSTSVNFDLHLSEEENIVVRILELAGVAMNRPDIQQAAMVDKQMTKQEQNN